MNKKSVKPGLMVMFLLLSCRMLFADVILDTIAKFVPANKAILQGVIPHSTDYQFDNFIIYAGYAQGDTGTEIPLLGRPDFEQVMVFSFVGYPVSIDSITESADIIKIYYHLPDYKGSYQGDEYRYPPRDIDEVKMCTMPKTTKEVTFILNYPATASVRHSAHRPPESAARFATVSGHTLTLTLPNSGNAAIYTLNGARVRAFDLAGGTHALRLNNLPRGTYIVKAQSGAWNRSARVLVK